MDLFCGVIVHLNVLPVVSDSVHLTDISSPGQTVILPLGVNSAVLLPAVKDILLATTCFIHVGVLYFIIIKYQLVAVDVELPIAILT